VLLAAPSFAQHGVARRPVDAVIEIFDAVIEIY